MNNIERRVFDFVKDKIDKKETHIVVPSTMTGYLTNAFKKDLEKLCDGYGVKLTISKIENNYHT